MCTVTLNRLSENFAAYINEDVISEDEKLIIATDSKNYVVMTEDEYNGLIETIEIMSNPKVYSELLEAMNTPSEEFLTEEEFWEEMNNV